MKLQRQTARLDIWERQTLTRKLRFKETRFALSAGNSDWRTRSESSHGLSAVGTRQHDPVILFRFEGFFFFWRSADVRVTNLLHCANGNINSKSKTGLSKLASFSGVSITRARWYETWANIFVVMIEIHNCKMIVFPRNVLLSCSVSPRRMAADFLHFSRFISVAATALAVIWLPSLWRGFFS